MGYNNKILISDVTLSLGGNDKVNTSELAKLNKPKISHKAVVQPTISHEQEKVALALSLAGGFAI